MAESADTTRDVSVESSLPSGLVTLESILCTEELHRRPSRPPQYEKENRALVTLAGALADSPGTTLQAIADTILDITQCDSAGLSLPTSDGKTPDTDGQMLYWPAIAGIWSPHVGGGTPRNFGPCGDVLDQNRTLLFRHFERRYPYLLRVSPAAEECLAVPFYVAGKPVGTIWAILHSDRRKFDAEDVRIIASLGRFASSAYQVLTHVENLRIQVSERQKAETEVRELARGLEARIRRLVEANVVGIAMWNRDGAISDANDAFLRMVQYDREDLASGRVLWANLTPAEWRRHDEKAIAEVEATGVFQPFEKELFRKDGSRVPVLMGGALFEGSETEGLALVLDLSEQKRAERALRRSEAILAEGQRLSQMGSFSWRPATDEVAWSEELYRIHELEIGVPMTLETSSCRVHPEDLGLLEFCTTRRDTARWTSNGSTGWSCQTSRSSTFTRSPRRSGTRTADSSTSARSRTSRRAGCRRTHSTRREHSSRMWRGPPASPCSPRRSHTRSTSPCRASSPTRARAFGCWMPIHRTSTARARPRGGRSATATARRT